MPICDLCPRKCSLTEGHFGFCGVRQCQNGEIILATHGQTMGFAVDPIEKKPFNHFYPGSKILSFGSIGCNLACRFCQNWPTARSKNFAQLQNAATPEAIVDLAQKNDCASVAFTYNEPIISAEFVMEVAKTCRRTGIKTVAVSNGFLSDEWRKVFFEHIDAANIDLKAFSDTFYRQYCSASLEPVKETIQYLARQTNVWLEVTTLLIPSLNDSDEEIEALSRWLAKEIGIAGREVPLHFSAYRPAYQMTGVSAPPPTPPRTLFHARELAMNAGLWNVYTGNIDDPAGQTTYCPQCKQAVISRNRFQIDEYNIDDESCCKFCGQSIAGRFAEENSPYRP